MMQRNKHSGVKRVRQQQLRQCSLVDLSTGSSCKKQRFWPCPVCNRSFAVFLLNVQVNQCLDSSQSSSPSSGTAPESHPTPGCEPAAAILPSAALSKENGNHVASLVRIRNSSAVASYPDPLAELSEEEAQQFHSVEVEKAELSCESAEFSVDSAPRIASASAGRNGTHDGIVEEKKMLGKKARHGNESSVHRPPAGFKLFQRHGQSQARLSMFCRFSSSPALQRKRTMTVLQPGLVLFRSWLDLETQQKFVQESQGVVDSFHRPTTSGGGKYHIYSTCWGPKFDARHHRYVSKDHDQVVPAWMFQLAQKLAQDSQQQTPVYPSDAIFAPDVGLVNFYPVKADELGIIGLGGHQDLDDSCMMPVVSVSVGDSMTFFYRQFPPLSRRRSGISVSVDEKATKHCKDGDVAHNREHQILLESGDVLVFGGKSRLIYHGTRHVQAGTRPPGLHMVPGRLNFTFRQTSSKLI